MREIRAGLKKVLIAFAVLIATLLVAQWPYFWRQIKFRLSPESVQISKPGLQEKMQPNRLLIPSLGITAPILYAERVSEADFQKALQNGVVHYPNTAKPGEFGNVYIFGHSSDYAFSVGNYKTVFALLPKIEIEAEILISNENGDQFVYKIMDKLIVNPNETKYLDQYQNKEQLLTLQTSYPVGTAWKRFLVIAKLAQ